MSMTTVSNVLVQ